MFRKLMVFVAVISLLVGAQVAPALAANMYEIDAAHSTLGFAVKHLQVGTTRGGFTDYSGVIEFDPADYATFKADVSIQVNSIDTNNEKRDGHLRSADFFDVETFQTITFKSDKLEKRGEGAVIIGDLTIKGVTKQLTIPVEISGPIQGMGEGTVIGITGQTTINRQDFGVSWNKTLDAGGLVVDDMVNLVIEIEAHKS